MCLMFKLSAKMRWMVPYDSPTISETLWIVCLWSARIASRTFDMFPVLCLSTVVQNAHHCRQTFVCPWSICTIKSFALAYGIISEGFLQHSVGFCSCFFKTETKFNADFLLLKTSHTSCKKNCQITKT
jgi:hypothetical protein